MSRFVFTEPPSLSFQEPDIAEWQVIHDIADSIEPELERDYINIVNTIKAGIGIRAIEEAFRTNSTNTVLRSIGPVQEELAVQWSPSITMGLQDIAVMSGEAAIPLIPGAEGVLSVTTQIPAAATFASTNAASLVTGVTNSVEASIRKVITESFLENTSPRQATRLIKSVIGLTERQATAVLNLRKRLLGKGVSLTEAILEAEQYADRLLLQRASGILRTETIRAANKGQQTAWMDAADRGIIQKDKVRQVWIVTPDDRLDRIVCFPMAGQQVGLGEEFTTGTGEKVDTPPAHPLCRCAMGLVFL